MRLSFDVETEDAHRRRLVFIHRLRRKEAAFINDEMVRRGLARVYYPGENERHRDGLLAAQREARKEGRGIWKDAPPGGDGPFVGTRKGHAYHRPGCASLRDAAGPLVEWATADDAVDAGRSACRTCKP